MASGCLLLWLNTSEEIFLFSHFDINDILKVSTSGTFICPTLVDMKMFVMSLEIVCFLTTYFAPFVAEPDILKGAAQSGCLLSSSKM